MFISFNGKLHDENENIFSAKNRAYNYGDGCFDSLVCLNGAPKFFNAHLKRLQTGIETLKINNQYIQLDVLQDLIKQLLTKNNLTNAKVRITISRKDGGLYTPDRNNSDLLIVCRELEQFPFTNLSFEKEVCIVESVQKHHSSFSSFKNCNSLVYVLAGTEIKEKQCDDGILLNGAKNICEALFSNLFFIKENTLFTPLIEEGCIDGVMRKFVMENCPTGYNIKEGKFSIEDLLNAEEVFVTNASQGIVPVKKLKNKTFCFEKTQMLFEKMKFTYYHQ
ncbi:MAG TPA: aminotransferase class IV [Bacteroidia bacterium]|nr:aminotransferase class IV [Bacteroidia bacterium]HNU33742.1 aminotransferase class IV [Bacteroidia bacterium]